MFQSFVIALLLALPTLGAPLKQIQAFNCDIDDNILFTPAKIMVYDTVKKKERAISTTDWAKVQLGKGDFANCILRPDGLRYFTDNGTKDGVNLFKNQLQKAISSHRRWRGPSWNAFVAAMSDPETRKHTTLITARMHAPSSILLGLKLLKEKNLIPAVPDEENIFPVEWTGFPHSLTGVTEEEAQTLAAATTPEKKANVMRMLLDRVEHTDIPDNQDGTAKEKLHLWGFSDDDYKNFSTAVRVLSKDASRWPHVKIAVFFTGASDDPNLKRDPNPILDRSVVLKLDGSYRATNPKEATRMGN